MKRIVLLSILLITAFFTNANNLLGGEITWECASSGQYIFKVVRYENCNLPSVITSVTLTISGTTQTVICPLVSSAMVSPQCPSTQYQINCGNSTTYSPVKRFVYVSAPVTLGFAIPVNGLVFSYTEQLRPNTTNTQGGQTNGYQLRAIMYPYTENGTVLTTGSCYDNSPQFGEAPRIAFNTSLNQLWLDGSEPDHQDSVFFNWAQPLNYMGGSQVYPLPAVVFDTGYAYNYPLPSALLNPGNIDAVLLGTGSLKFKSLVTGRFTYCYKIASYRNGQLISEVFRDIEFQINVDGGIPGFCGYLPNNVPTLTFVGTPTYPAPTPILVNGQISHYEVNVLAGDSITFTSTGEDYDVKPDCTPGDVTGMHSGLNLGQGCQTPPCATVTSLNAGGLPTALNTSSFRFSWGTDTAHVRKEEGHATYDFFFEYRDGNCVLPGQGTAKVQVKILRPIYASAYSLRICQGDSAQVFIGGDTSNLSWSGGAGVSCTTCANPFLYPSTSTVYTVTDVNTGYQISIEVQVDPTLAQPQFAQVGNSLVVGNAAIFDTIEWRRNFAPFYPNPTDSYTPFLSGGYWVQSSAGACEVKSQKINMWFTDNLAANSDSTGEWFNTRNAPLTHGCTFRLQQEAFYTLNGVYLHAFAKSPQSVTTALKCKIYDQANVLVFSSDSAIRVSDDIIKFYGEATLQTTSDYLLAIYTDTSVFVPTFKPTNWPVVANQGRVLVFNATNAVGNTIPTNNAPDYPFVHFSLKWAIGLEEQSATHINIYPNPADDLLIISAEGASTYTLSSATGQRVLTGKISNETKLNTAALPQGFYVLTIHFVDGRTVAKRVVIGR